MLYGNLQIYVPLFIKQNIFRMKTVHLLYPIPWYKPKITNHSESYLGYSPWCDTFPCRHILTHRHHCNNHSCSQMGVCHHHVHTTCLEVLPEQSFYQNLLASVVGSKIHLEFSCWTQLTCASYRLNMLLPPGQDNPIKSTICPLYPLKVN